MKDAYSEILESELTPDLQLLAAICGKEAVCSALRQLQGINIYIPKISRLDRFTERYIKANRSMPLKEVALSLNISESTARYLRKKYLR